MRDSCLRGLTIVTLSGILVLVFSTTPSGKSRVQSTEEPPEQRTLSLRETVVFQSPPLGSTLSWIRCDAGGNIFVPLPQIARNGTWTNTVVAELLTESRTTRRFGAVPFDQAKYPNAFVSYFDVDRHGAVYALFSTHPNDPKTGQPLRPVVLSYFIEHFNDDGSADSIVPIGLPEGAAAMPYVYAMAVAPGDRFLLTGTAVTQDGLNRPFTALYDSTGRFLRNIEFPDDVKDNAPDSVGSASDNGKSTQPRSESASHSADKGTGGSGSESQAAREKIPVGAAISTGSVVTSPDGYIYVLRNSDPLRLYGVSLSGDPPKHFQFAAPAPGLRPFTMEAAGPTSLVLDFWPMAGTAGAPQALEVFDTDSGRLTALYQLPESAGTMLIPACSDRRGGFLYLGESADKQHLAVFRYTP